MCGPFATPSRGGNRYFMLFIDGYTRWTDVWLLPNKQAETSTSAYQSFQKRIEAIGDYLIRRFRCDNGRGEYDNKLFRMLLAASGTSFEPCPPHAHHKNGVAERMIGVITEKARAMIDSQAPLEFWGEAVGTAVYLHRLTPNEGLTKRDGRDIKSHTRHHTKCCMLMANLPSMRMATKYRTKHPSTTCDDLAALSVD